MWPCNENHGNCLAPYSINDLSFEQISTDFTVSECPSDHSELSQQLSGFDIAIH